MTRGMGKMHFLHFVTKAPDEDVGEKKKTDSNQRDSQARGLKITEMM